jgi:hypothetical protein
VIRSRQLTVVETTVVGQIAQEAEVEAPSLCGGQLPEFAPLAPDPQPDEAVGLARTEALGAQGQGGSRRADRPDIPQSVHLTL